MLSFAFVRYPMTGCKQGGEAQKVATRVAVKNHSMMTACS